YGFVVAVHERRVGIRRRPYHGSARRFSRLHNESSMTANAPAMSRVCSPLCSTAGPQKLSHRRWWAARAIGSPKSTITATTSWFALILIRLLAQERGAVEGIPSKPADAGQ